MTRSGTEVLRPSSSCHESLLRSTLNGVSDSWLERGHGTDPAHLATLFSSDIDGRGPGALEPTSPPEGTDRAGRRSSRVAVAAALWVAIVAGTGGAAWAVRDALFPSIGAAEVSVWQNPGRETTPPTAAVTSTSVVQLPPADDDTVPDVSTATSVADDSGPGHGGPANTTVDSPTPSTVDDHGGGKGSSTSSGSGSSDGSGKSGGSGGSGDSGSGGGSGAGSDG